MSEPDKKGTPPPLLLMGASTGPSWNSPQGLNLFMPVPQSHSESSLFGSDEGGEEDSFIGQSTVPTAPMNYFQPPTTSAAAVDPFANVGHHPLPPSNATSVSGTNMQPPTAVVPPVAQSSQTAVPPPSSLPSFGPVRQISGGLPPVSSGVPPQKPVSNIYRQTGSSRYAQPPQGTYGPPAHATPFQSLQNSMTSFLPPPFSDGSSDHHPPASRESDVGLPTSFMHPGFGSRENSYVDVGYVPVQHHWFHSKNMELRQLWVPCSHADSYKLEQAITAGINDSTIIRTDGGRYDVSVASRTRMAVYWEEDNTRVRRCSWFYKLDGETKYKPYEEDFADKLEETYKQTIHSREWHKRHEFPGGDSIVMHNPNVIVHFTASAQPDEWGTTSSDQMRPRVVRRGVADINEDIKVGEPAKIDHVVFIVHGIGATCDLRFRNIVECVDEMRSFSLQMCESHFKPYQEEGRVGRVEFLPVRWHSALHGDATGVDRRLKSITLGSIGKLRHFTNDTLLDILFYSSPAYAQQIANTVASELNRLRQLFLSRNTQFVGDFSVCGHSLGSLILFDLMLNQNDPDKKNVDDVMNGKVVPQVVESGVNSMEKSSTGESTPLGDMSLSGTDLETEEQEALTIDQVLEKLTLNEYKETFAKEKIDMETLTMCEDQDLKEMGIPLGPRKKLQGFVKLQKHKQKKRTDSVDEQKRKEMEVRLHAELHKHHPPVHSRNPLFRSSSNTCVDYVQGSTGIGIPFVKYPELDFHPMHFFALGSPIAMFLTVRGVDYLGDEFKFPTCPAFFNIFHPFDPVAYRLEPMIVSAFPPKPVLMPHHKGRKRLHLELRESLSRMGADIKQRIIDSVKSTWQTLNNFANAHRTHSTMEGEIDHALHELVQEEEKAETESVESSLQDDDILVGNINQGRRIDYVLQEKPIESFNDYLFALASHLCYWQSEDTVLLILKEIYLLKGIVAIKPGAESPNKVPLGPPPSMMNSAPTRNFTGSVRDFAANVNNYANATAQSGYSSSGYPSSVSSRATAAVNTSAYPSTVSQPSQSFSAEQVAFPIGHVSSPSSFADAQPSYGSPYAPNSAQSLSGQTAPSLAPLGTTGPPPLSGFVRKS